MSNSCDIGLSGSFRKICGYKPKQGIKRKWYGNHDDIDREATILVNRGTKIKTLVLKEGAKLFPALGNDKTHGLSASGVVGDYANGFIHTDVLNIMYRGDRERERVQEIVDGARVFSIVECVDQGINGELAFEVAGFESGMLYNAYENDFVANSGVATLTVATKEGEEEGTDVKLFQMNDYSSTKAWIESNEFKEDQNAPSTPLNLTANNTTSTTTDLSWDLSTDDVAVTGYKVYKDGVFLRTVNTNSASITALTASTSYDFTVSAVDASGNESSQSVPVNVTTTA